MSNLIGVPKIFSSNLKALRKSRGLTQQALALKAGISVEAIRKFEGGNNFPMPSTVEILADALECEKGDLTSGQSIFNSQNAANLFERIELYIEAVESMYPKNSIAKEILQNLTSDLKDSLSHSAPSQDPTTNMDSYVKELEAKAVAFDNIKGAVSEEFLVQAQVLFQMAKLTGKANYMAINNELISEVNSRMAKVLKAFNDSQRASDDLPHSKVGQTSDKD